MPAGELDVTGTPTIEVRIHHNDRPPVRAVCESDRSRIGNDEDQPLATRQLPGYGTE
jgi:hypothetical protein